MWDKHTGGWVSTEGLDRVQVVPQEMPNLVDLSLRIANQIALVRATELYGLRQPGDTWNMTSACDGGGACGQPGAP